MIQGLEFISISEEGLAYVNMNTIGCLIAFFGVIIFLIKGVSRIWTTQ